LSKRAYQGSTLGHFYFTTNEPAPVEIGNTRGNTGAIPQEIPQEIPTEIPQEIPTEIPQEIPTEIPQAIP
jgi:hypothetical protein